MIFILPQIALQRIIQEGFSIIKQNPELLDGIFSYYTMSDLDKDYGQAYIDKIKTWVTTTKIPIVQAWSMNAQQAPQISIKLASEQEDEGKAAIGDHWGDGEEANIGTSPFIVNLDIMLQGTKNSDEVMWLYYMTNYILFKRKRKMEAMGLQLSTFNASDYSKENGKLPDNVYARYIRFRAIVQNFWDAEDYLDINDLELGIKVESSSEE